MEPISYSLVFSYPATHLNKDLHRRLIKPNPDYTRKDYYTDIMSHEIRGYDNLLARRQKAIKTLDRIKDASLKRMTMMETYATAKESKQDRSSNILAQSWTIGDNFTKLDQEKPELPKHLQDMIHKDKLMKEWKEKHHKEWVDEINQKYEERLECAEMAKYRKVFKARLCSRPKRTPWVTKDTVFYLNRVYDEAYDKIEKKPSEREKFYVTDLAKEFIAKTAKTA